MGTGYRPERMLWLRQAIRLIAVALLLVSVVSFIPTADAQSERLSEQERRINGLVKTGRAMLTNQQYARAYKHFLTYARQQPEEARLYRWLVLSSLYADRKDALTELMLDASEQETPTTKLPFLSELAAYALAGGVLAAIVFALSVVTIPMIVDRHVDASTAMRMSLRVTIRDLPAMIVWAVVIAALVLVGFATSLIGMIFIFPLLGHATWRAYRELVD